MPSSSLHWPDAALAGLGCAMRTSAGPAMLAAHGRIRGRARVAVLLAATGELAMDKSSKATDRTDPPAAIGRVLSAVYTGREVASVPGAVAGGLAAAAGTFASWRARRLVVRATGLPDVVVAVGEDVVAMGVAAVGTRPPRDDGDGAPGAAGDSPPSVSAPLPDGLPLPAGVPPHASEAPQPARHVLRDAGVGLLAGIAGTAAMTIAQGAEFVLTDAEPSTAPAAVADRLKRRAGRGRLKRRHRRAANQAMHWLYGVSWGIPYGVVATRSRVAPEASGAAFGLLVWGAGLAHQPALGIAEVPWKRSLQALGSEVFFHVVYGMGAAAAVRALR